ncbi:hypothetical protein SKAU_G00368050 [Synaphobranchus kaupii]|uniref:Uncharacterized protein n=1 Tax=Synaphobranchus kaupii TaxID=118154 RepID=A0A9Q1EFH6_SYNKA|nr:hypothetical protein SKAU_G00368050 [Synaphobranchus kaupii]
MPAALQRKTLQVGAASRFKDGVCSCRSCQTDSAALRLEIRRLRHNGTERTMERPLPSPGRAVDGGVRVRGNERRVPPRLERESGRLRSSRDPGGFFAISRLSFGGGNRSRALTASSWPIRM